MPLASLGKAMHQMMDQAYKRKIQQIISNIKKWQALKNSEVNQPIMALFRHQIFRLQNQYQIEGHEIQQFLDILTAQYELVGKRKEEKKQKALLGGKELIFNQIRKNIQCKRGKLVELADFFLKLFASMKAEFLEVKKAQTSTLEHISSFGKLEKQVGALENAALKEVLDSNQLKSLRFQKIDEIVRVFEEQISIYTQYMGTLKERAIGQINYRSKAYSTFIDNLDAYCQLQGKLFIQNDLEDFKPYIKAKLKKLDEAINQLQIFIKDLNQKIKQLKKRQEDLTIQFKNLIRNYMEDIILRSWKVSLRHHSQQVLKYSKRACLTLDERVMVLEGMETIKQWRIKDIKDVDDSELGGLRIIHLKTKEVLYLHFESESQQDEFYLHVDNLITK